MHPAEVSRVVRRIGRIEGWFSPQAAALFGALDEVQRRAGVGGGLFEIGAHHGKSTVVLAALARDVETVGVCDVFGSQDLNVSASGSGDRARFERNLARCLPGFAGVAIFEKLSSALTEAEIGRPQRIFHVDGGHLAAEALADLHLGAAVLHEQGAIVVDDPFRADWPGVTEGILRFLGDRREYAPIILGFNKLVLVNREARSVYAPVFSPPDWRSFDRRTFEVKTLPIGEDPVAIFFIPSDRQIAGLETTVARLQWARSAVGRRARRLLSRATR